MKIELCEFRDLETFDSYLASFSSPIDSFLEEHLLESVFWRIVREGSEIGSCAIHNGLLLTQFHIVGGARRYSQALFDDTLNHYKLTAALIPTCDEFFLSHALDRQVGIKKQAFFFIDNEGMQSALDFRVKYRQAVPADIPSLSDISNSIIDDPRESIPVSYTHLTLPTILLV